MQRKQPSRRSDFGNYVQRGRRAYRRRAWADAYEALASADRSSPLEVEDIKLLAMAAYLTGRDVEYLAALERAYHAHVSADEYRPAARCAFWIGLRLLFRGEVGQASGWLARAQRLLEEEKRECAERGYLLLPLAEQQLAGGDYKGAYLSAANAARLGTQCREPDLVACALHLQGKARIQQGCIADGLPLLDEAMVGVAAGELSPLMTGLIYCSVIDICQQVYALERAREWTSALRQWCEEQPQIVAFTAVCQVHRAEILRHHGAWSDAIEEARHASQRCRGVNPLAGAAALYEEAEIHRLRGEFAAAETAYQNANQLGLEPQPGLALLRLAQGRIDAAVAAIRRVMNARKDRLQRTRLLPAHIEIMLAAHKGEEAREACRELEETAATVNATILNAMATYARGSVELAEGDPQAALARLRSAFEAWQRTEVPYWAARARVLLGLACRALGDDEGSRLELEAARTAFAQLGAGPDVAAIGSLAQDPPTDWRQRLTERQLQILRLVATGKTNKSIAATLRLSEKTVDRHISNIFVKLDVSSRVAATAYAYEHRLI